MEYQVFMRALSVKLAHGVPLFETDNLGEASSFVYKAWRDEREAMVIQLGDLALTSDPLNHRVVKFDQDVKTKYE